MKVGDKIQVKYCGSISQIWLERYDFSKNRKGYSILGFDKDLKCWRTLFSSKTLKLAKEYAKLFIIAE